MKIKHSVFNPLAGGAAALLIFSGSAKAQNLFVADFSSGNITEITPDGAPNTFASGLNGPFALAFNGAGDLFEADYNSGNIYKFTPDGKQSTFASGLNGPVGLAFDSAGDLYEADNLSGTIYKFNPDGKRSTVASVLFFPQALAINRAGDLFVAIGFSRNNDIIKITPDGAQSTFATFNYSPIGLALDSAGNLFVSDNDGYIYKFTPDGVQSTFTWGGGFGLAFNDAGDLFEADALYPGDVMEFTPDGTPFNFASGLGFPFGLAFAPPPARDQTVYVGNPALPFVDYAQPDGVPPLVIMGEYSADGPLSDTVQPLPRGDVQDVKFYGQDYDFTLYALHRVSTGPNADEQTFKVAAAEHFSGYNSAPGAITLAVSNFQVRHGDFLAFSGIGPWYPQQPNDALNTDATYEDAIQPDPVNDNDTATPPVPDEVFTVGVNRDAAATYGYIADNFGNQGRIYAIGVDVKKNHDNCRDDHR
jgi:hypothetical protein